MLGEPSGGGLGALQPDDRVDPHLRRPDNRDLAGRPVVLRAMASRCPGPSGSVGQVRRGRVPADEVPPWERSPPRTADRPEGPGVFLRRGLRRTPASRSPSRPRRPVLAPARDGPCASPGCQEASRDASAWGSCTTGSSMPAWSISARRSAAGSGSSSTLALMAPTSALISSTPRRGPRRCRRPRPPRSAPYRSSSASVTGVGLADLLGLGLPVGLDAGGLLGLQPRPRPGRSAASRAVPPRPRPPRRP